MTNKNAAKKSAPSRVANRKAHHEYTIEERLEAGIALMGWEVKALRAGRLQIAESYVVIRRGEAWLLGAHITPLLAASTHVQADPTRTRKLLLHREEINRLIGHTERKGYTLIPLAVYWKKGRAKLEIGLAKGKKQHDKRADAKEKSWQKDKQRILKHSRRT